MSTARFRIKRLKGTIGRYSRTPWKLVDRTRPALILEFRSLDRALTKMDNIMRAEHGWPPRLNITKTEILEHMEPTA